MKQKKCCFIGHRKINITDELKNRLTAIIENLIVYENVDTFFFGSKSMFDDLCYKIVSKLKEKYPNIKRIYIRAEFPYIDEDFKAYLLQRFEDTYYPDKILGAGRAAYVERNIEMINQSDYCVVYYNENYQPPRRKNSSKSLNDYQPKSGTKIAHDYAKKKGVIIFNVLKYFYQS